MNVKCLFKHKIDYSILFYRTEDHEVKMRVFSCTRCNIIEKYEIVSIRTLTELEKKTRAMQRAQFKGISEQVYKVYPKGVENEESHT